MKPAEEAPRKTGRPLSFHRDEALRKAMLMFWAHGYEGTSISLLESSLGVNAPSIYTAFGDKKRLFLEALQLYVGDAEARRAALAAAPSAGEAAHGVMVAAATAFTGETTPRGCLLASATASGSAASLDVQKAATALRDGIRDELRARIDIDIEAGLLPRDTNARALANLVVAVVQGLSALARDGAERGELLAVVQEAAKAWPSPAEREAQVSEV